MRLTPEHFFDRGCWISDDRVYAFISSATHGIAEVGYHGLQPVSRNSRIFVGGPLVCRFALASPGGEIRPVVFQDFDWTPGCVRIGGSDGVREFLIDVTASGSGIIVRCTGAGAGDNVLSIAFRKDSLFTGVQGERTWSAPTTGRGWAEFRCRDRILLRDWIEREGPYAGDFLIPEHVRRTIFKRRCRSGLATHRDLLPEYVNSPMALYDAVTRVRIGGAGYQVDEQHDALSFTASPDPQTHDHPPFSILFGDRHADDSGAGVPGESCLAIRASYEQLPGGTPSISLPGYPETERFATTVPGLVHSCIIRDFGIPRATPGRYYWIWAWDAMVTALASLRWGDTETARATAVFVDGHRDVDGLIPMQWTRALEPLDTQPRGSLETLLTSLVYATAVEAGDETLLARVYPLMTRHLTELSGACSENGLFRNIGFYPDLPGRFHRTEDSAVAMETGGFYTFCRTCENAALQMGDVTTAQRAREMASIIQKHFLPTFWDDGRGFLIDAVDMNTGDRSDSFPLFTLLFLHSPLGLSLLRPKLAECAAFVARHHLTEAGLRLLPLWDKNSRSETVSESWYPHWDVYAMTILRRAGLGSDIMRWVRAVEAALHQLGYCPEYLPIIDAGAGFLMDVARHGSPSNLNCVIGWYTALLQGLYGFDVDPGGITMVPLALPVDRLQFRGIVHRGTRWNVDIRTTGARLQELRVDGDLLSGCCKIPSRYSDGGEHIVEIVYSDRDDRSGGWQFREITNAEVLDVRSSTDRLEIRIRALGTVDLLLSSPVPCAVWLDEERMLSLDHGGRVLRSLQLPIAGVHTLALTRVH